MANNIEKYAYYIVVNLLYVIKVTSLSCPNNGIATTAAGQETCYWLSTITGTADIVHNNCVSNGGRLALITNDEERIAAESIVTQAGLKRTFIGVKRSQYNINNFVTWLEEPQPYFRWDWARNSWGQQPDNTNEKCVSMFPMYWHDDYCSRSIYGICSGIAVNGMRVEGNTTIQVLGGFDTCIQFRWFQDNRVILSPINTTTNTDLRQCIKYCQDYVDCTKVAYNDVTNTCLIGNNDSTSTYASGFTVYNKV